VDTVFPGRRFEMSSQRVLSGLALLMALIFPAASPHQAAAQLVDFENSCTGLNCDSIFYIGQYRFDTAGRPIPFEAEIFSTGQECVRLEVVAQDTDLEAVLVSPDGFVWRDDDGGAGLFPLVQARTTVQGWYTLQLHHFGGTGVASNFFLLYGRYTPSTNPNCSNPTTPLAPERLPKPLDTSGTGPFIDEDDDGD
jgi:hypothetical protein